MEFSQWNVLSFLNSLIELCMSICSTSLDTDPNLTIMCGLWVLLLFLCFLVGIPSSPTCWETKVFQKRQGRAKRRRKGGTSRGWSYYQREIEEKRKLISILKSPPGQHHTIRVRQLLCPDPSCEVCNRATAEVNRLLFLEDLEDDTLSVPTLASTASVTGSSFTLSSAFSEVPLEDLIPTPPPETSSLPPSLADFLSPSPLGHSLPPEPFLPLDSKFPADQDPPQPLAFPHLPPHDIQTADPVLQPEATLSLHTIFSLDPTLSQDINPLPNLSQKMNPTDSLASHHSQPTLSVSPAPDCALTVTQSKSVSILLKAVPENSSPDSPGGLSTCVPRIRDTGHSSLSISELSWVQAHAKDVFSSTLAPCDFNQEFLALNSSEASSEGEPAANLVETGNLSFLSPDVLALLERQVQKRSDFLIWKESSYFPKGLRPDDQLNSSGKLLESTADKHDSAVSLPFWSIKGKPKELHVHQQPPYPKTLKSHLKQKCIQFFWGLPSLHSESLPSAVHVLGDCSTIFLFNTTSNASMGQESPALTHPLPLSLPEIQPQSLPQCQPLPLTQVQPQAHLQSPLPILPSGPLPQIRICGVCLNRPQNESESLTSSEIQQLEWNVLQKQQESLRGLPSVVQRSQEEFCPSAPSYPNHRASQAHVSISIRPAEFPLSDELQKKLDHHLRKKPIQHRWGLPNRIHESLSLMMPPTNFAEISESESSHRLSWNSVNENLNVGLSQPESFHERGSEPLQLEKDVGKDHRHSPENGPKAYQSSDPQTSSDKDLGYDSEKDLNSQMASLSGKNSRASGETVGQKQLENVLKAHLSKKFEEINEGRLPGTVHSSWHAIKQTLLLSDKSHTQIKQRSLPPSVGGDHSLDTFQELSFIDSGAQQMLEAHIKRFRMRMLWGLPRRVLESIEIFQLKDATFQSLSHSHLPSSTNLISEVDSTSGGLKLLRGSSNSVHRDKLGTINSAPVLGHPLPATSPVRREGHGAQRSKGARQTLLPVTHGTTGKASQRQTQLGNRCPLKLPAKQVGARHEPKDNRVSSSDRAEMRQCQDMEKKSETSSRLSVYKERFRAEGLNALQSKTGNVLTISKPASFQMINVNEREAEITVTTETAPPKRSVLQDPKSSDLKEQLLAELKSKLEKREQSQAEDQLTDPSLASESLTYKASLTHAQGVSIRDMKASQVQHIHLEDRGVSTEQQETRVPKHIIRRCQDENFPPASKRLSPPGPKAEELGGGNARLGTSQPRRKSFPTQDMALKKTLWSKSSQTRPWKEQPPESLFRKKLNHFLQWLHLGMKCKRQENSQEKGSPISSTQSRGLVKRRAAVTGTTTAQKPMTDAGKFQEEKLGHRHAVGTTCPPAPLPSPRKSGKTQQRAEAQARAEPVQGHPSYCRARSCKATNTKSCRQEAVFAGQSYPPSIRWSRDDDRLPQKVVAFKGQQLDQKQPSSVLRREPVPLPNHTCRCQAGQGPPTTLTTTEGTVFRDPPLLFQQKMLLQHFQKGKFPTPK